MVALGLRLLTSAPLYTLGTPLYIPGPGSFHPALAIGAALDTALDAALHCPLQHPPLRQAILIHKQAILQQLAPALHIAPTSQNQPVNWKKILLHLPPKPFVFQSLLSNVCPLNSTTLFRPNTISSLLASLIRARGQAAEIKAWTLATMTTLGHLGPYRPDCCNILITTAHYCSLVLTSTH